MRDDAHLRALATKLVTYRSIRPRLSAPANSIGRTFLWQKLDFQTTELPRPRSESGFRGALTTKSDEVIGRRWKRVAQPYGAELQNMPGSESSRVKNQLLQMELGEVRTLDDRVDDVKIGIVYRLDERYCGRAGCGGPSSLAGSMYFEAMGLDILARRDFALAFHEVYPYGALRYVSRDLLRDKEFVLDAIRINAVALKFASKRLRNTQSVVLEALEGGADCGNLAAVSRNLRRGRAHPKTCIE